MDRRKLGPGSKVERLRAVSSLRSIIGVYYRPNWPSSRIIIGRDNNNNNCSFFEEERKEKKDCPGRLTLSNVMIVILRRSVSGRATFNPHGSSERGQSPPPLSSPATEIQFAWTAAKMDEVIGTLEGLGGAPRRRMSSASEFRHLRRRRRCLPS